MLNVGPLPFVRAPLSSSLSWAHQYATLCAIRTPRLAHEVNGSREARDQAMGDSTHERPVVHLFMHHRHRTHRRLQLAVDILTQIRIRVCILHNVLLSAFHYIVCPSHE